MNNLPLTEVLSTLGKLTPNMNKYIMTLIMIIVATMTVIVTVAVTVLVTLIVAVIAAGAGLHYYYQIFGPILV